MNIGLMTHVPPLVNCPSYARHISSGLLRLIAIDAAVASPTKVTSVTESARCQYLTSIHGQLIQAAGPVTPKMT